LGAPNSYDKFFGDVANTTVPYILGMRLLTGPLGVLGYCFIGVPYRKNKLSTSQWVRVSNPTENCEKPVIYIKRLREKCLTMPMSFPDMESLRFAAEIWKFRPPDEGESDAAWGSARRSRMGPVVRTKHLSPRRPLQGQSAGATMPQSSAMRPFSKR
jgi:hypothetical protein